MFHVDIRTNKHDIPAPTEEVRTVVILRGKYLADAPAFPNTAAGWQDAERIARLLNTTIYQTTKAAQREMRNAIGLPN